MTPIGYIMLPLGVAGLLLSRKWLYRMFVFWTLFSATSAMNFGDEDNGYALQRWMFFSFLRLLRLFLNRGSTFAFSIDRRIVRPRMWLIGFATVSLIMPILINGRLLINSPILGIGWGSATSHNLIVKLLSNVGVVRLVVFIGAMGSVMIARWHDLGELSSPVSLPRSVWLPALAVFLLTSALIELPLVFGNFGLVLGMVLETSGKTHNPTIRHPHAEAQ